MYNFFQMELIGDNNEWPFSDPAMRGAMSWRDIVKRPPRCGVSVIKSASEDRALDLKPMRGIKDYSRANSKGSRGVYRMYELPTGFFYVIVERVSWKRTEARTVYSGAEGIKTVSNEDAARVAATELYARRAAKAFDPPPPPESKPEPTPDPFTPPWKRPLGVNVLDAAKARIRRVFADFPSVYLSFSGGKDSTVLLHLAAEEARRVGRKFGLLFIDLEAQYSATVEHVERMFDDYADVIEPYWLALPLALRNAVSQIQPKWLCWDPEQRENWVRQPPARAYTDPFPFPWYSHGMEFEELIEEFGQWYGRGKLTCCLVGIRCDESLNRWRAIVGNSARFQRLPWTTLKRPGVFNAYPIYDWRGQDIWTYHAQTDLPYNRVYDLMHLAGVPLGHMRICQPYGDDQKKGLWLYHLLEPDTWAKLITRVSGANGGALYAQESGAMTGRIRVPKPEKMTWREFCLSILETMPPASKEHYEAKIGVFVSWYATRGYPNGIPDEADPKEEAARKTPSWRRVARVLLKNDWWCKGLSFSQHIADSYERYMKVKKARESQWRHLLTN